MLISMTFTIIVTFEKIFKNLLWKSWVYTNTAQHAILSVWSLHSQLKEILSFDLTFILSYLYEFRSLDVLFFIKIMNVISVHQLWLVIKWIQTSLLRIIKTSLNIQRAQTWTTASVSKEEIKVYECGESLNTV